MNIEIKTKHIRSEDIVKEYIELKVGFALERIDTRIERVFVRLEDNASESKRFEGQCNIEVWMHPKGHVHVSAKGDSAYECILNAVRKMEQAVKHDIDRHRRAATIRHQQAKRKFVESLSAEHSPDQIEGTGRQ